ncbi:MAG: hypothetical protein ACK5YI_15820 [Rhodospirillales bacterium]|jgi:hypothetical protein
MTSRRRVLAGLAATAATVCAHPCCAQTAKAAELLRGLTDMGGCALKAGALDTIVAGAGGSVQFGGAGMIPTSGNPGLDRALGAALVRMAETFGERPGFAFYDDSSAPNAYATSDTRVEGTWGTVLFGRKLFWDLVNSNSDQGMAVVATLAHEFAHVVQFRRGLRSRLLAGQRTVRRMELHADYLSGFYLGLRKRADPSITLLAAGALFRYLGDLDVNSRDHHGTPDERIEAAEAGFAVGFEGHALRTAIEEGIDYVLSM